MVTVCRKKLIDRLRSHAIERESHCPTVAMSPGFYCPDPKNTDAKSAETINPVIVTTPARQTSAMVQIR
jgi:ketopantoate reductase